MPTLTRTCPYPSIDPILNPGGALGGKGGHPSIRPSSACVVRVGQ